MIITVHEALMAALAGSMLLGWTLRAVLCWHRHERGDNDGGWGEELTGLPPVPAHEPPAPDDTPLSEAGYSQGSRDGLSSGCAAAGAGPGLPHIGVVFDPGHVRDLGARWLAAHREQVADPGRPELDWRMDTLVRGLREAGTDPEAIDRAFEEAS